MAPKPRSRSGSMAESDTIELNQNNLAFSNNGKEGGARKEILYEGSFYDVSDWVGRHPGGKVINYYTETHEDSTIAVQQFHSRAFKRVQGLMKSFKKRPPTPEEATTLTRHKALDADFKKLYEELKTEGYFDPSPLHIAYRLIECLFFKGLGCYIIFYHGGASWFNFILGLLTFQAGSSRAGWLQHEAGHYSLTGNPKWDRFIHSLTMSFCEGLSTSWWTSQHNRHHAMPQRMHRDVDLNTLPFMAFNTKVVKDPKEVKNNLFVKYQAILFLPIQTGLVGLFWKLYAHPKTALYKQKYLDLVCMVAHYFVFLSILGLPTYLLLHWIQFAYYFGNFALSHTHLPVTTDSLHWVEYALNHTTNINPSWWCNWWMGYLNLQIEHHLFPTMPQFRHPAIAPRVQQLAKKHGIKYNLVSYAEAVKITFRNLDDVAHTLMEESKSL